MKNNFRTLLFLASIALMSCSKEELITNTTQAATQAQTASETKSAPETKTAPEQQTTSNPYEPFVVGKDGGCGGIPGKKDTLRIPVKKSTYKDTICGLFEPKKIKGPTVEKNK